MRQEVLILQIADDFSQSNIDDIKCHADLYGMKLNHERATTVEEFSAILNSGKKYDYLILAGHGSESCLTDNILFNIPWSAIGNIICTSNCLNPDAILMMYCCKGGVVEVAYTLFAECPNITYVFGAKQDMIPIELTIGFNIFMYNVEYKGIDPILAARKSTDATDILFECFYRTNVEQIPHWHYNYCKDCQKNITETC